MNRTINFLPMLFALFLIFTGCEPEEKLEPANISFDNPSININQEISETTVNIIFSRAVNLEGNIEVSIQNNDLVYGLENDFYTEPSAENNRLILNYEAGDNQIGFNLKAGEGLNIEEDKTIQFEITTDENFQSGQNSILEVQFSENFIAQTGSLEMNVGGPDFTQQAFVDLSKLQSSSVDKNTWDLAFYNGNDDHVTLNSPAQVMARPIDKTDLANVTAEDTVGFASEMQIGFTATPPASAWVDEPNGDLSKTAIAPIASSDAGNKVYIIRRLGEGRSWKKVKITQNGDGYTIAYADIDDADFETSEISKSESHNFIHFDLDNGVTEYAPEKDHWDLMYGTYTEKFPLGDATIPYSFNDYIILNHYSTTSAMVMIEGDTTYEDFSIQQAQNLTFNNEINAIGSNWRQGGGPNSAPAVFDDRFFIIQDSQGNYYKIKFISMYDENNERGLTTFEFEIL